MTPERRHELATAIPRKLTREEWAEGWHFCWDWDGMLVNSNDTEGEGSCCTCVDIPYPEET